MSTPPPLKPLHADHTLSPAKLAYFDKLDSVSIRTSLAPPPPFCLKAKPDGTMLDGHHRIHILRSRNENVDLLPRELILDPKELP